LRPLRSVRTAWLRGHVLGRLGHESGTPTPALFLCGRVVAPRDAELPFSGWRNEKGIDARGLANILRPYDIRPKNVRVAFTGQGKGYERGRFENAWARYTRGDQATHDPSHTNGSDRRDLALWDAGTDGTDEVQPPAHTRVDEREP
jgi:Protein of unknown function (DUF3631)